MKSFLVQARTPELTAWHPSRLPGWGLVRSWQRRRRAASVRTTLSSSAFSRLEVRPPPLRHAPSSAWHRFVFWLLAPAPHEAAPPLSRLPAVQLDFHRAIMDIDPDAAYVVSCRIAQARSLRELWHMRMDVYNLVALHHDEAQAELRVASLNRHFPARAPRSGFTALDA